MANVLARICSSSWRPSVIGGKAQAESPEWMPASSMCSIAAEKQFLPVVHQSVHIDLDRVVEELVDQHRVFGTGLGGALDVGGQHGLVVHDLHAASAQHVGRAYQHRVADLGGDGLGLGDAGGPYRVWARAGPASCSTCPNAPRSSARWIASGVVPSNGTPSAFSRAGQAQRRLSTELADDPGDRADGLLPR